MSDLNYDLNSDSDEEEEDEEQQQQQLTSSQSSSSWTLEDIDQLKIQTNQLLDPAWKLGRYRQLLHKMLDLEQPAITAKMVEFLMQDSVCEALVGFITQNGSKGNRPGPNDPQGDGMRLAHRAVLLLSPEIISDPLNLILSKKTGVIARKLFDIFKEDSAGSFYHAYRVLECLLRCYPAETFDGLNEDGHISGRMADMLKFIGYAPVCEFAVMLIAFTPVVRSSQLCITSSKNRWIFLDNINTWNIMLNIVRAIVNPMEMCFCNDSTTADQHSTAASQLFQDLVEKLSLEDSGDLLFLPLAQTSDIIDMLICTAADHKFDSSIRRAAAKNIAFLLRRAAEPEVVCFMANNAGAPPTPTYIPNRLHTLRDKIVSFSKARMDIIIESIIHYDQEQDENLDSVKYSSYEVKRPFGVLRQLLIELLVLTVESDDLVASVIPFDLWKLLISWILRYAHNNVFHALFYRLVFAVLRQGKELPQRCLFQKALFLSFLVDNFVPYQHGANGVEISAPIPKSTSNFDMVVRRTVSRGLIMNCANAIRFQASSESSNSFLVNFLANHKKWNDFLDELTIATDVQMKFGMGIRIVILEARPGVNASIQQLMLEAKPCEDNMDHSTRFAKSLGFFEESQWSLDVPPNQSDEKELEELPDRRLSYLAYDDDEHLIPPPPPQSQ